MKIPAGPGKKDITFAEDNACKHYNMQIKLNR